MQGKAEDADGLTPVKDDNAAMRFPAAELFSVFLRSALILGCLVELFLLSAKGGTVVERFLLGS